MPIYVNEHCTPVYEVGQADPIAELRKLLRVFSHSAKGYTAQDVEQLNGQAIHVADKRGKYHCVALRITILSPNRVGASQHILGSGPTKTSEEAIRNKFLHVCIMFAPTSANNANANDDPNATSFVRHCWPMFSKQCDFKIRNPHDNKRYL